MNQIQIVLVCLLIVQSQAFYRQGLIMLAPVEKQISKAVF